MFSWSLLTDACLEDNLKAKYLEKIVSLQVLFFFMGKIFINIEALNERTACDNELAEDLLNILKTDSPSYKIRLINDLSDSNYKAMAGVLHKMKSAVALFGFDNIKVEIENVEKIP